MHKCYTFLIFMVLLLPSLGLSRWVRRKEWELGWGNPRMERGSSSGSHLPCQARDPMSTGQPQRLLAGTPHPYSSPPAHLSPLQPGPLLPLAL